MKWDIVLRPEEIEKRSMEIITQELGGTKLQPDMRDIIVRTIHTTADFDYADTLCASVGAVEKALHALRHGAQIITDTNMAFSGINKKAVKSLSGQVRCYMSEPDVAEEARLRGVTRASVAVERAWALKGEKIFAVGNAPTALMKLHELMERDKSAPELIIGVPVGFVNVVEAKELIIHSNAPYIVNRGRKGGSNVAAAIINALLYQIIER